MLPTPTSSAPGVSAKERKECPGKIVIFKMGLGKTKWTTLSPLHVFAPFTAAVKRGVTPQNSASSLEKHHQLLFLTEKTGLLL